MPENRSVGILFIGNSHTYFNDMPRTVREKAEGDGYSCRVTMIAHPGWFLAQHAEEPEARFNILNGGYDYVVLQEHAHPFGPEEKFMDAAAELAGAAREAGSKTVVYETWAKEDEPEAQERMNEAHRRVASAVGALLAPVGEKWQEYRKAKPEAAMYAGDGAHASPEGSAFAAQTIWDTVRADIEKAP